MDVTEQRSKRPKHVSVGANGAEARSGTDRAAVIFVLDELGGREISVSNQRKASCAERAHVKDGCDGVAGGGDLPNELHRNHPVQRHEIGNDYLFGDKQAGIRMICTALHSDPHSRCAHADCPYRGNIVIRGLIRDTQPNERVNTDGL